MHFVHGGVLRGLCTPCVRVGVWSGLCRDLSVCSGVLGCMQCVYGGCVEGGV